MSSVDGRQQCLRRRNALVTRKFNDLLTGKRKEFDLYEWPRLFLPFLLLTMNRNANELLTADFLACELRHRKDLLECSTINRDRTRCHNDRCSAEGAIKIVGQALESIPETSVNKLQFIDGVQEEVGGL
jgi:hypothetical protein